MANNKSQRGFAIGTILLAVVLIAAIVSAVAVASRGSLSNADKEKGVLARSMVINEYTQVNAKFDSYAATSSESTASTTHLINAGYMTAPYYNNGQVVTSPGQEVWSGGLTYGQIDAQLQPNGIRTLIIYGVTDIACNALNQQTYSGVQLDTLRQKKFTPQFFGMQGYLEGEDTNYIVFDDGIIKWDPTIRGRPSMYPIGDPSFIHVFPDKPICTKLDVAQAPGGSLNTVFIWRY